MSQHPVHGTPVPFGPWATIGFGVLALLASSFIGFWLISILYVALGTDVTDLTGMATGAYTPEAAQFILRLLCLTSLAGCILVYYLVRVRQGDKTDEYLGLRPFSLSTLVPWLSATIACALAGMLLIALFGGNQEIEGANPLDVLQVSFLLIMARAVIAPMWEELLFRGFIFEGLKNSSMGTQGAIILPAIWWAGLHLNTNIGAMLGVFLFGLLLGYARERHGSILLTIVMHGCYSLLLFAFRPYWA